MLKMFTLATSIVLMDLAGAAVETAKVQSEQPHPLPFSEVTKYEDTRVCVRRDDPNATETCYQRQTGFQLAKIKKDGQFVFGADPSQFRQYINQLSQQDNAILSFLAGTLELCKDYKITKYFTTANSERLRPDSVTSDLYALEVEFKITGAYFSHRLFVLGRIATFADQTRYLTYDGLADYDSLWAGSSGVDEWEKKFGLPFNGKREDLPKFLKRGAGFVAPYALDYILAQRVLNPRP